MVHSTIIPETKATKLSLTNAPSQIQLWSAKDAEASIGSKSSDLDKDPTTSGGWRSYIGMILTLVSSLLFSSASLIVKVLQPYEFHGNCSSFWRYLGVTLPAIPLLLFFDFNERRTAHRSVFDTVWPMNKDGKWKTVIGLLARGALGGMSVMFRYYALEYLTLADTSVITYSSPILVTILAHFLLGETMGIVPVFVTILTLCGVVLIAHPPILTGEDEFEPGKLIGIGLACGSLICAALIVIITRKIRDVHFSVMTIVFGVIGLAQAYALTQYFNDFQTPQEFYDTILVVGLAIVSFLGQMTIIMATQFEQAGPVSLIRTCDVVFGFILQFVFLGVIPTMFSAIGGGIVLSGVVVTGLRKYIGTRAEDDPMRRRFRYILK